MVITAVFRTELVAIAVAVDTSGAASAGRVCVTAANGGAAVAPSTTATGALAGFVGISAFGTSGAPPINAVFRLGGAPTAAGACARQASTTPTPACSCGRGRAGVTSPTSPTAGAFRSLTSNGRAPAGAHRVTRPTS